MRKTALGFLACWAIPALSYELNSDPTINGLQLVDSYSQRVPILDAGEAMLIEPGVFSMLDGITGLSPIPNEPAGISRIKPIDAIGPVFGVLFAQGGQPKAVVEQIIGVLNFANAKNINDAVLASKGQRVRFVFDEPDSLHSAPTPTIQRLREADR